ncbi:hypothetical protein SAMN06295879_0121 [Agreia bicolorata]|uniref:SipW-cognate class signal peptide n=1 Tax=Agreia bicolorata TaxID=110935 RepID=A0A1T4WRN9_9MICO|nr:hypothetical protein [Agreia bicolorata]KJC64274.1 hypothetical protein TZ00_07300 [Agreia bicolorata]SKA79767.1 hypothetical protein SAMN06295879_0121 [Agreia bicolorata]
MSITPHHAEPRRTKFFVPIAVVIGLLASFLLAASMSGAFSGFTASINNSANSVGSGTLLLTETQGATTCLSSAAGTVTTANAGTCASINKLNGTTVAAPNVPYTSTVTLKNNGTAAASSFTLTPSGCTTTANGTVNGTDTTGFCGKVDLTIQDTTTPVCVFPAGAATCAAPSQTATLATLGTTPITLTSPLAAGASRTFTFTVMLDSTATNADQGLLASEQLLWSLAA